MIRVLMALAAIALSAGRLWPADNKPPRAAAGKIDFAREVKPILSNHCYAYHGPDSAKRKAGLRLDRKEDAFRFLKSGEAAVVPGDPSQSALIRRVTADDDHRRMPPKRVGARLSKAD